MCVDLAPRSTAKIGNCGRRNFQAFQLLLSNRMSNRPHIALNVSLGKRTHRLNSLILS
jgi:hypothetical protein